jgi:membrane protease YdiL (CAAX protease family)
VAAVFVPVYALAGFLNDAVSGHPVPALLVGLLSAAAALAVYTQASARLEHRRVTELDRRDAGRRLGRGFALGTGLFAAVLGLIALFGGVRAIQSGSAGALVSAVGLMAFAAVSEELLFRGLVFRGLESKLGSRAALLLSALLFGGLHLLNPHATLWGATAIAIEAGLMFAAIYAATRSLWLVIGLHFGWNLFEGGVFGTTVSGSNSGSTGLMHTVLHGPALLTGGGFGPEASLLAIAVCLLPTAYYLRRAARTGRLQPRRSPAAALAE